VAAVDFFHAQGVLNAATLEELQRGIPASHGERVAETLLHEYTHSITLLRFGDYTAPGWDWDAVIPKGLLADLRHSLALARREPSSCNIGELIAEDGRRFLSGRRARLNRSTYLVDVGNVDAAWERAQRVWT
jgi:hypothetical protein